MDAWRRTARLAILLAAFAATTWAAKPNILLMMADDLGWNDVGYNGGEIKTSAIDRLAAEGLRLDRYYAFSLCTPTRAAIMTGRSPMRFGLQVPIIDHGGLPLDETTLGDIFGAAGYQTWFAGKWHLGHSKRAYFPNERGWSHSYGSLTGGLDHYSHNSETLMGAPDWHRNGKPVEEDGHSTDLYTAEALRLIQGRDRERPFLLYVAWNAPHTPLQAPEEYLEQYRHIDDQVRRTYAAMVTHVDDSVASLIGVLDQEGLRESTLVIFLSDNGGFIPGGADNGPLRGGKGSEHEGGTRVPGLVSWPGTIEPGIVSQQVSALDWLPTLIAAAGIDAEAGKPFDGFDMWPALTEGKRVERGDLVLSSRFGRALFRGPWKYLEVQPGWLGLGMMGSAGRRPAPGSAGRQSPDPSSPRSRPGMRPGGQGPRGARPVRQRALYDIVSDPQESADLASGHGELVNDLAAAAAQVGAGVSIVPGRFSLREGGRFVQTGPLETYPEANGAHVIYRVDE